MKNPSQNTELLVACPDEPPYRQRFERYSCEDIFTLPHRQFRLRTALDLAHYVRHQRIDVIHSHGKGAGLYSRLASFLTGKPSIHTPHGIDLSQYGRLTRKLYRLYENATAPWIKQIIFVSDEEKEVAHREKLWLHTPAQVIVNGVDEITSTRRDQLRIETRHSLGVSDAQRLVVTLSRFDFQKNMQEAYAVAKALPNYRFLWVGDGPDAIELANRARADRMSNLQFLGKIDDPTAILAAADVYFSSARWEGMPLAVLEAMSLGLPVVATDVTGHREIVADSGCGLLYPSGNPSLAVARLTELLDNVEMRQQMGNKGRMAQQTRYSSRQMASKVFNLYKELCMESRL